MLLALLGFLGLSAPAAQPAPQQGAREVVVLPLDGPGDARELRAAGRPLWHDAGSFAVCGWEETLAERAGARVAQLEAREGLYLVARPDATGAQSLSRAGARVLARDGAQLLVSVDRRAEWLLRALCGRRGFHCGVVPIRERAVAPPRAAEEVARGASAASGTPDPRVAAAVQAVDAARIERATAWLSTAFTTRLSNAQGARDARMALRGALNGLGLSTRLQSLGGGLSGNVVGELVGVRDPRKVIVIGAHYDSINTVDGAAGPAPGADDNASGVAGVLEAARVLARAGPFEHTLRFVLFSGEEQGLIGSNVASDAAMANGDEILAMLNLDMIAYRAPGDARDVDLATNGTSPELTDLVDAAGALYVPGWASSRGPLAAAISDHLAYDSDGWPTAFLFEDRVDFFPARHSAADSYPASTNDFELARMITGGAVAAAALVARPAELIVFHSELGDTATAGPFPVTARVRSTSGARVSQVTMRVTASGAMPVDVPMVPVGPEWSGSIPALPAGGVVLYSLHAVDEFGREATWPADGSGGHSFLVGTPSVLFSDDLDGGAQPGWEHGATGGPDEWEENRPRGRRLDPPRAASGFRAWGQDLGVTGEGAYAPGTASWLRTPAVDLAQVQTGERVVLEVSRWLTVGAGDEVRVAVEGGGTAWRATGRARDLGWGRFLVDLTGSLAPGAPGAGPLRVEFWLEADGALEAGGWTLDDVRVLRLAPPGP